MIRTQGDTKIFMLPGGIEIIYDGGQPIMDSGLENAALIYLFTERGWPMNNLLPLSQQIGSDFLSECRKSINITQLRQIEIAATAALKPFQTIGFGKVRDLSVRMITGNQIYLSFVVDPPGANATEIQLSGFGANWKMQSDTGNDLPPTRPSEAQYLLDDDGQPLYDDGLRPLTEG